MCIHVLLALQCSCVVWLQNACIHIQYVRTVHEFHDCMYENRCVQSDHTYPYTSVLDEIVHEVRELDK